MKNLLIFFILLLFMSQLISAQNKTDANKDETIKLLLKPSLTDNRITHTDVEHLILHNKNQRESKLFLFLPGTNGIPVKAPYKLLETALEQGYKVINLSYINQPSVASQCKGERLKNDIDCTETFRNLRVFGKGAFETIPDQAHDAIESRLKHLLIYLAEHHNDQRWDLFLKDGEINWENITVAGQSQGGGMSAFIAKKRLVNRIITFSGGWDYSVRRKDKNNDIAHWYYNESITPCDRYYGVYHTDENTARFMQASYEAMCIPKEQIHVLTASPPEGKRAHGQGIRNIMYKELWKEMMGSGDVNSN